MPQKEDLVFENTFDVAGLGSEAVVQALHSREIVRGYTHNHYRYPARFSPEFAREAIQAFSRPGDLVMDPFMGGGTSAVESIALGRRFLGSDVNELAHFATQVKTEVLESADEAALLGWVMELPHAIERSATVRAPDVVSCKHVPWHLRNLIGKSLGALDLLRSRRQQQFARCSLLRSAQWALDCKSKIPSSKEFLARHGEFFFRMLAGHQDFSEQVKSLFKSRSALRNSRRLLCLDAAHLGEAKAARAMGSPRLVLTSPPYLGVHVVYHRWQVKGRRETPAPYWIAGRKSSHSSVFYTFADRRAKSTQKYYEQLGACFGSLGKLLSKQSLVVQLVAFNDADVELARYLEAMRATGFEKCEIQSATSHAGQVIRDVPNRRWYALMGNQSRSSEEFLLVHRLKQ